MILFISHFGFAQYQLQKTYEFKINSLNSVEIVDYDPINKHYLGYEIESKGFIVLLLDNNGNVLHKKNLMGQGPGQFNSAMNFLGFSDQQDIWIITPNQLITYDRNFIFKRVIKYVNNNAFFTSRMTEAPVFFHNNKGKNELVFATYPSQTARFMSAKSLEKQYLIELYDTQEKKTFNLAPFKQRPIYKYFDNTINTMYKPIFTQDKKSNRLFVTATLDNEITVIDLLSRKTISNIKIIHGDYGCFKKFPVSDKTLPSYEQYTLASENLNILYLDGGFIVLDYVREIPYGTFEKKKKEDQFYHHFNDPDYHRIIIFDEEKQLSKDLQIPYGQVKIAMPNNSILIKLINPDEEEDFVRYGVYQVSK